MPTLKYKDPADGVFKQIAGPTSNEVHISAGVPPVDAGVELWMDTSTDGSGSGWAQFDARYALIVSQTSSLIVDQPDWIEYGSTYSPGLATRQGSVVTLEGMFKTNKTVSLLTTGQSLIATIPSAFRPVRNVISICQLNPGVQPYQIHRIEAFPTGELGLRNMSNATVSITTSFWMSFTMSYRGA